MIPTLTSTHDSGGRGHCMRIMRRGLAHTKPAVLCVDDNPRVLQALRRLLRKERYRLVIAESGAEALSILEATSVPLVVSDQCMPGMSGIELLLRVRDRHPKTTRLILSGFALDEDVRPEINGALNTGLVHGLLTKPWNDEGLRRTIRQYLRPWDWPPTASRRLNQRPRRAA